MGRLLWHTVSETTVSCLPQPEPETLSTWQQLKACEGMFAHLRVSRPSAKIWVWSRHLLNKGDFHTGQLTSVTVFVMKPTRLSGRQTSDAQYWPTWKHYTWLTFCRAVPATKPSQSVCKDTNLTLTLSRTGPVRPSSKLDYEGFVAPECGTCLTCEALLTLPHMTHLHQTNLTQNHLQSGLCCSFAALQTVWSNLCKFFEASVS